MPQTTTSNEKIRKTPGRKPTGSQKKEKNHYITENDREYLLCAPHDRKVKYGKGARSQNDLKIERWARKALTDLVLIAMAYPERKNQKIFTINIMRHLLRAVVSKQKATDTGFGKYYQVLIKEIAAAMCSDLGTTKTIVSVDIKESPLAETPMGSIGLIDRTQKDYEDLLKKGEINNIEGSRVYDSLENKKEIAKLKQFLKDPDSAWIK